MVTRKELYDKCVRILSEKGFSENCGNEVSWVFQGVLGEKNICLSSGGVISREQEEKIVSVIERRSEGYPLQYLLGEWEFYGMRFKVGEGVLIPRQDTETLVDVVVNKYKNSDSLTLVDLCSGSGCIALALEKQLDCERICCVEKSEKAVGYLRENIAVHGSIAEVFVGDVLDDGLREKIPQADVIVCNPPYLTREDMEHLQREVTFEPETALYGGDDGLDFYREIVRRWKGRLKAGGGLAFEIGMGQEDEVMRLMIQHGFLNVRCRKDLCGINRCVIGEYPGNTM